MMELLAAIIIIVYMGTTTFVTFWGNGGLLGFILNE